MLYNSLLKIVILIPYFTLTFEDNDLGEKKLHIIH